MSGGTDLRFWDTICEFQPQCEQEQRDKEQMIAWMKQCPDTVLTRENPAAHMTASSMILTPDGSKALMVYHHIYRAWSWTGGHADGQDDPLAVARKEAEEETGVHALAFLSSKPASLEILPVWGHWKHGAYVCAHLHLNVSYLFTAPESAPLQENPSENSGVRWIPVSRLAEEVTERDMLPVYQKLIQRVILS